MYLPWLPAERAVGANAAPPDTPFAVVHNVAGALRIAAVSAAAEPLGVVGLTLADARARLPSLVVVAHDPAADAALLDRLADGCECFSPTVAVLAPQTIMIDITGCRGGDMLAAAAVTRLARHGVTARTAVAGTPDAAAALAKFDTDDVAGLPVSALDVDPDVHLGLRRAGLTTIGALVGRPRAPLAARFGAKVPILLARLAGEVDTRLVPRRQPPEIVAEHRFAEPITTMSGVDIALDRLLLETCRTLVQRGQGGRRFELGLFRSDGHVERLEVASSTPTRDATTIRRLIAERIAALADPLDPGFGFDLIRFAVPVTERLVEAQLDLDGGSTRGGEVAELVDRLTTRLGANRIRRLANGSSHVPEQASFDLPTPSIPPGQAWLPPQPGDPPLNPLHMFTPPQPIQVMAAVPDGPPLWFRWHRKRHDVSHAEGPLRIAAEWWRRRDGHGLTRDYYRVESGDGHRYWVFRHGLYAVESVSPDWYLHGLFA